MTEESKISRRLRRTLIFLFTMLTLCLSMPFGAVTIMKDGNSLDFESTGIDLIFSVKLTGDLGASVLLFTLFLIIPVVGFFAACFDIKGNVKNIIAILGSAIGITALTFLIGARIRIGGLLSMLLYLCTFVVGVMSLLVKYSERRAAEEKQLKKNISDKRD